MRRLLLISLSLVAAVAVHTAVAGGTRAASLTVVRICSGAYQDQNGECRVDQRKRMPLYPEVRCSVHVYAPRPTRFTARLYYEGQLERTDTVVLSGRRTRAIAVAFRELGDDYGVPGGRYTCRFSVGGTRAAVTGLSRGPRRAVRGPGACSLLDGGPRTCNYSDHGVVADARTIGCSVVLVGMRGRTATTRLEREVGGEWRTLYEGTDPIRVPIAEVWAYTSRDFPPGPYRCRFLVNGTVVADHPFAVK